MTNRPRIRLVSPLTTKGFRSPESIAALSGPAADVDHREIVMGPASIESEFEEIIASPGTISRIIEAERDGVDAVVVDCMADPGVRSGREMVTIPVFGPAETSMHVACTLGHSFAFLSIFDRIHVQVENLARLHGLSERLVGVRGLDTSVLELESDLDRTKQICIREAKAAVLEDKAHVIIFGCTGLLGCADAVRQGLLDAGLDVPVIDPIPTTIQYAAAMVRAGLAHSKRTFPRPPAKRIDGYASIGL